MTKTTLRTTVPAAALSLATVVAAWEFFGLRAVNPDRPLAALESPPVPWGGLAGREAARGLEGRWRLNPGAAAGPLMDQLGNYPLDPWRWLLYARIQWDNNADTRALRRNLDAAVSVQPHNREVRWRAANLAQSTGDADLVLDQLAQWLADEPRDTARALFIAGRWTDDPGTRIDRVVPDDEAFLTEAMRYAYRSHNVPLAQAVWQRLDHPRAPEDRALADYVTTALNNQRPDLAMQGWQQVDADYTPGDIPAGDFEVPLEAMATFGWSLRVPDGVEVEREQVRGPGIEDRGPWSVVRGPEREDRGPGSVVRSPKTGRGTTGTDTPGVPNQPTGQPANQPTREANALRISFNGKENVHLATPSVRFPMPEPGRYVLTGWWRAADLTTRSLPYLQLYAESPDHRFSETLEVPDDEFEWQPFEIPFEVTQANEIFRFRLRRNRTEAFDRYIAGSVWISGLEVREGGFDGGGDSG